ncbi:dihydropteroate synthase [Merismopedia glauca]|uniref:Dihydropteroate synthase n=1 Tax=Merismopedia glauca CCAP 1448/3 TaxID=1296344 RepID=A0A2T1CAE5_9CYAN|nr:dihydropteroate synthase [Merismopedia glauca]PSB05245.1 dihydropteroate synthase [Merismopedia glauca CCAP 1448/3]
MTAPRVLNLRSSQFIWGKRTYLMAVVNVTPDSFSDGGEYNTLEAAVNHAEQLVRGGADILDIGGESSRPGAKSVDLAEELDRTIPVISALRQNPETAKIPISIDTTKAIVAEKAIAFGADLVNDISGATFDPQMLATVARLGVPIILMHSRGTPQTMQTLTDYQDVVAEICQFLKARCSEAIAWGISPENIIIDPGVGFAKTYQQNIEIFQHLNLFKQLGFPLLVGPSRKSFIGHILRQSDPQQRIWGTAAACCRAIAGGTDILRVHDLPAMFEVSQVADALFRTE